MGKSKFELFSDSGRFLHREVYLEKNPDAILHEKCTDVIVYNTEGLDIQALHTGEFYYNDEIRGRSLDEVELKLFTEKVENKYTVD